MSEATIRKLVEARLRVVNEVNQGRLSVNSGAKLLGITRQGLWKLRKSVARYGAVVVTGRKRGPKYYQRPHNRTQRWIEDTVEKYFNLYGIGVDRICWLLEDVHIHISRATAYRILVRKRLIIPKSKEKRKPVTLYAKGFPGEEVQIDTTEPFGKKGIILISAVDDHSRWGMADCYYHNNSENAANFVLKIVRESPFPIRSFRTDNGSEFKKHFSLVCKRLGIEVKRNPVNHPTSNGKVERLHRTIEEECFWRVQAHREDINYGRYWLSRYLAWYNTKRRHGGYGMKGKTPQQKIQDWILTNKSQSDLPDVNQTLILYKT
ncbi:MAG: DDE-type integrase/transposase/recombinase [Candidatus Bathyarchaeia archaeon]